MGFSPHSKTSKRAVCAAVLFCFLAAILGASVFPTLTQAQEIGVGVPVNEQGTGFFGIKEAKLTIGQAIWASAIVGIVSAVNIAAQQFAYDLAVGLATAAKGQNPLAFLDDPGTYFTKVAYDAAGEFIWNLSGPWEELGLNLCSPRIPDIGLAISLGIAERFQRPTPRCNFAATLNNWAAVAREARDPQQLLKHVSLAFDPAQSDIGQAFRAQEAFRIQVERRQKAGAQERTEGGGILPKVDLISGTVRTPAETIRGNFQQLAEDGKGSVQPLTPGEVLGAVGGGEVWLAVGATALNTFANTLVSRLLRFTLEGIFGPRAPTELPDLRALAGGSATGAGVRGGGGARAAALSVGLLAAQLKTPEGNLEYLPQLATCPAGLEGAGQFNCVIDQQFMLALQSSQTGRPLTVSEAVAAGYLDRAKPFGYVQPAERPAIEPLPNEGYAYSSMKKLRLLRVIPVGWEFAAEKIRADGTPATLGDVLDGWDTSDSRFYRLVDPNWVLKAPTAKCGTQGFGARLDGAGVGREEECADIKHCVAEDDRGQCRAYGYCMLEKNVWQFEGDSCEPQYASCDTFRKQERGRSRGQEFSFLESTVDFGVCNAENVGCAPYFTEMSVSDEGRYPFVWNTSATLSPRVYLDGDAPACDASAAGCTELISSARVSVNLVNNGSFETDADGDGFPDGWINVVGVNSYLRGAGDAHHGSGAMFIGSDRFGAMNTEQGYSIAASHTTLGATAEDEDKEPQTAEDEATGSPLRRAVQDDAKARSPAGGRATGGRTISQPVKDGESTKGTTQDEGGKQPPSGDMPPSYSSLQANQTIALTPGKTYTISLFAKLSAGASYNSANPPRLQMTFAGLGTASMRDRPTDCDVVGDTAVTESIRATSAYQRFSCSFSMPFADPADVNFRISTLRVEVPSGMTVAGLNIFDHLVPPARAQEGVGLIVDALQIEEGTAPTDYHDGYGYVGTPQNVYYRLPPEDLGCTGEESPQEAARKGCDQFAGICRESEVGCERYTPEARPGSGFEPGIPGIIAEQDRCPAECVGYDTYIKQSSRFEPTFTARELVSLWPTGAPQESLYPLIPSAPYAQACSADSNGCDEFTNLRTEAREYFTDLRACETPSADSDTYFTWEGSDTAGYQLKTWNLKRSNEGPVEQIGEDSIDRITGGAAQARPPCTNYRVQTGAAGIAVQCVDEIGDGHEQAVCLAEEVTANPDCRAFYDEDGNIFYRLMSRTIVSTPECQSYRWTGFAQRLPEVPPQAGESIGQLRERLESTACTAASGSWDENAKQCIYVGAPSLSRACPAQFNSCRGFRGNTGSNVAVLLRDRFEESEISVWSALRAAVVSSSPESLVVGEHSLGVRGAESGEGAVRSLTVSPPASPLLNQSGTYFVAFNIKGTLGRQIAVFLKSGAAEDHFGADAGADVILNPEWQHVELGPLTLQNIAENFNDTQLVFRVLGGSGATTFFIDDVALKRTQDVLYLVKNSLRVPSSCDAPARGTQLGCRAYSDRAMEEHTLKSFTSLCRDRAVGCTAVIDTRNSSDPGEQQFNTTNSGVCRGEPGPCRLDIVDPSAPGISQVVACTIPEGQTSCTYGPGRNNADGTATTRNVFRDDITVPEDRSLYVVVDPPQNPRFACRAEQKGCQAAGTPEGQTVYLRNDPERYGSDLCVWEAQGCAGWQKTDQSLAYFKDPSISGAGFCEWKTNTRIGNALYSGWLKKDPQPVAVSSGVALTRARCEGFGSWRTTSAGIFGCVGRGTDNLLSSCGGATCAADYCNRGVGGVWEGVSDTEGVCKIATPCYGEVSVAASAAGRLSASIDAGETYLQSGTQFGIWQNADADYAGQAGFCPKEQATCAEFVDPTDSAAHYFKDNERLAAARRSCSKEGGAQASRAQGCVLFDDTGDPRALWNVEDTYAQSEAQGGAAVRPVDARSRNNANTVLKVKRDRQCSEWLQCESASFVWDESIQKLKSVCHQLGRCAKLPSFLKGREELGCEDWVGTPLLDLPPTSGATRQSQCERAGGVWHAQAGQCELRRLTAGAYDERDTRFTAREFSGYTIPNTYPMDRLQEWNISASATNPDFRLVYVGGTCTNNNQCVSALGNAGALCAHGRCIILPDGRSLQGSQTDACSASDPCSEGRACLEGRCARIYNGARPECRAFPEKNAPFPNTSGIRDSRVFQNAPRCKTSQGDTASSWEVLQCGCNYNAVSYGADTRYFGVDEEPPAKICVGGTEDGAWCEAGGPCVSGGGVCTSKTRELKTVGWQGYCLDPDTARPIYNRPDQQACLAWWPVGQIVAAPDINNQYASAGYVPPETGGRYWCLASEDAVRTIEFPEIFNEEVSGQNNRMRRVHAEASDVKIVTFEVPSSYDIRKYNVKGVAIEIAEAGETGEGNDVGNGLYYIESNVDGSDDHIVDIPIFGERDFYESFMTLATTDRNWWWWAADDHNNNNPNAVSRSGAGLSSATLKNFARKVRDFTLTDTSGEEAAPRCSEYAGTSDNNYDAAVALLRFDDNQKLSHIRLAVCTNANNNDMAFSVRLRIHPPCTYIMKVDPLNSAPWTHRLSPFGAYNLPHESGFNYTKDLALFPFGSSSSVSDPPITGTERAWFLNWNRLETDPDIRALSEFAGWPFACALARGGDAAGSIGFASRNNPGPQSITRSLVVNKCSVNTAFYDASDVSVAPLDDSDPQDLEQAKQDIDELFARSFKNFGWFEDDSVKKPNLGHYYEMESEIGVWDNRSESPNQPQVSAEQGGAESDGSGITVNGSTGGDILGYNGFLEATVSFYGWADNDHMPLRYVAVDWDDGRLNPLQGLFRNHRAQCRGVGFGERDPASCEERPFTYTHIYKCERGIGQNWTDSCPNPGVQNQYGGCCVFRPAVQIRDNWGYCNGVCGGLRPDGLCIDEVCDDHGWNSNHPVGVPGPWTPFGGRIIVAPEE